MSRTPPPAALIAIVVLALLTAGCVGTGGQPRRADPPSGRTDGLIIPGREGAPFSCVSKPAVRGGPKTICIE